MKSRFFKVAFALVAIVGLTTVTGCKKGENDPFLSLKSRKGRISGEWKLSEGTITTVQSGGGSTSTDVTTYTGSSCSSGGFTSTYTEYLTIEKDGTFEVVITEDGFINTIKGNWYFSGKSKDIDLKKKEAIVFSETQYSNSGGTSNYNGLYADQIILIDQLKNKEMIFKGGYTYQESGGSSGSYSYDRTFEKQ